jgi:drug/metabolite transporter (DMT)-like permease
MNAKQWFLLALVPVMFSIVNFFMFSSAYSLNGSIFWFSIGVILFLFLFFFYFKSFSLSIQGLAGGVFNLTATITMLFLYSFNFLTNVFPFVAASLVFFFLIDWLVSRDKRVNAKMAVGVLVVFAGLIATQFNNLALNFSVLAFGVAMMFLVSLVNFSFLYGLDKKNFNSRLQGILLPFIIAPFIFSSGLAVVNFNGFAAGFLSSLGFMIFGLALIEVYSKQRGFWSMNLVNIISYLDIIILNVLAVLFFQGSYTLSGLVGSLIVFCGIILFIFSQPIQAKKVKRTVKRAGR